MTWQLNGDKSVYLPSIKTSGDQSECQMCVREGFSFLLKVEMFCYKEWYNLYGQRLSWLEYDWDVFNFQIVISLD